MNDEQPDYSRNVYPFTLHVNEQLGGSSGDDGGGGMEARIARLEADMAHVRSRVDESAGRIASLSEKVSDARTDIAVIKEKLTHLPSKSYAVVTAIAMVVALSALVLFSERLRTILGL